MDIKLPINRSKGDGMTGVTAESRISIGLDNTYIQLPASFYQMAQPAHVPQPSLIYFNHDLAELLGIDLSDLSDAEIAQYLSGNVLFADAQPIAMAYAGHQFGSFVSQLGDGRAILLGEKVTGTNHRYDIQLKGSGVTAFSRRGDGKSALGPVLREYIVSEAMHALGIPTTRALAMVTTGEDVVRQSGALPGAILTRVASGFVRVGTFEYFFARNDMNAVRQLADYTISRHYPEAKQADNPYLAFFQMVCTKQAILIPRWMEVGFIHGVMNTDNTSICGETIDYGPCAFMDEYDPNTVFSSIDIHGRYRFIHQGSIIAWNLSSLGNCLLPFFSNDQKKAEQHYQETLETLQENFLDNWRYGMNKKLGLETLEPDDIELLKSFLDILQDQSVDYTLSFRYLADNVGRSDMSQRFNELFPEPAPVTTWLQDWNARLEKEQKASEKIIATMNSINPAFIPRNHLVERAIHLAEQKSNFDEVYKLIEILANPYTEQQNNADYMLPPEPDQKVHQTFCGT
jgi:uncharacterized protein YdiU (UPF0061 family)